MSMLAQIRTDLIQALKEKKTVQVSVLRLLLAEIHNREMAKQGGLTEEEIVAAIRSQVKKRRESIEAFGRGGRDDLVQKERQELEILSKYLPQEMPESELEKIVKETIDQVGSSGQQDFGKVMGGVMGKIKGKVDGKRVAEMVKKTLS